MKQGPLSFEVSRVPPELVDIVWAQLLPMIGRGVKRGAGDATTIARLPEAIKRNDMVMWAVHDGADIIAGVVISVREYAGRTAVFVELAAGRDLDSWVEHIESLLRDYRELVGADTIEALCRDGMTRRLMKRWRRKATLLELK